MNINLTIETTHEEFVICICAAYEKANQEPVKYDQIEPFNTGEIILESDVENMLMGSCIAELAKNGVCEMRIEE